MKQFLLQFWPLLLCIGMMFFMHRPGAGHGHGPDHSAHHEVNGQTTAGGRKFRRVSVVRGKNQRLP